MSVDFSDNEQDLDLQARLRNRKAPEKREESLSSLSSSRTPSKFSETSQSDHSDYNDDFLDSEKVDLLSNFKNHNMRQQKMAAQEILKHQQHQRSRGDLSQRYYPIVPQPSYDEDFEPIEDGRFLKLKVVERKQSLPVIPNYKSTSSSPIKRVTKYASTLDLNGPKVSDELDNIEDLTSEDLTITYKDYQKLKRKSQRRIDLSKYKEEPSQHKMQHQKRQQQRSPGKSNFDRLTRQGKLRVITVMNKPNTKRVLKGHLYGEVVYDPQKMKWIGNEEELTKFNSINNHLQPLPKSASPQRIGNMVYDEQKLRWVSVNGRYEDDPFDDDTLEQVTPSAPQQPTLPKRSRIVPSSSSMSLSNHLDSNHFKVTTEMYRQWKHEEERWVRKVGNWFNDTSDELDDIALVRYGLKSFLNKQ